MSKILIYSQEDLDLILELEKQENEQLKIQISAREEVCNRLESNWNKLKEYLNYKSERAVGEDEYVYDEIYNEMQEMEKNYGNVENNT